MSDSDSDWESDSDVSVSGDSAVATPSAPSVPPAASAAVPSVLLAMPITLALKDHPALAAGIPAGLTLLYDQAKNVLTLLAYDQHKRPMLLEPFDGAKLSKPVLPFSLSVSDLSLSVSDSQSRQWTCTFGSTAEAARMACCIGVAAMVAKAAAVTQSNQIFLSHDLSKGAGKSCKPNQFASLEVRAWVVDLTTDSSARGTDAIARVTGTNTFTTFNPDLSVTGGAASATSGAFTSPSSVQSLTDVEIADLSSAALTCPTTIGEAIAGGKLKTEGGARILIVPGVSSIAKEVLGDLPRSGEGSVVLMQILPIAVSKKREKKEKKEKKKASEDSVAAVRNAADANAAAVDVILPVPAAGEPVAASSAAAAGGSAFSAQTWSQQLSSSFAALLPVVDSMHTDVSSAASHQKQIVKSLMTELYSSLLADFGLQAAADAQATPETADTVTEEQTAQLAALQTRVRSLVGGYVDKNSVTAPGTLASLVQSWQAMRPALQSVLAPEGPLGKEQIQSVVSSCDAASHSAQAARANAVLSSDQSRELARLTAANRSLQSSLDAQKKSFAALESKHTALVMSHVDLEESHAELVSSTSELEKKSQMSDVFESGLKEMRTALEREIEEKNQLQQALENLTHLQKAYKLTWVPDKAATHCTGCHSKFTMFGAKSRGHCRYCGRLYCKTCSTQAAIPEYGYTSPVKICRPCHAFRAQVHGERVAEEAAAAAEEAAAAQDENVLSYDSDELE